MFPVITIVAVYYDVVAQQQARRAAEQFEDARLSTLSDAEFAREMQLRQTRALERIAAKPTIINNKVSIF